jgi:hypothetical protein
MSVKNRMAAAVCAIALGACAATGRQESGRTAAEGQSRPAAATVQPRPAPTAHRARDLDQFIERARRDLAERTGTPLEQVTVREIVPTVWPDADLRCGSSPLEQGAAGGVPGFAVILTTAGRTYSYRAAEGRVQACPPIERR